MSLVIEPFGSAPMTAASASALVTIPSTAATCGSARFAAAVCPATYVAVDAVTVLSVSSTVSVPARCSLRTHRSRRWAGRFPTRRGSPHLNAYALCVCPVKITSTFADVSLRMRSKIAARRAGNHAGCGCRRPALVVLGDEHIGLSVGSVSVGEQVGGRVDARDRIPERQPDDAAGRHDGRGLLGHGTDHPDVDATDGVDLVRGEDRTARIGDVGGEVVPLAAWAEPGNTTEDPITEVRQPLSSS